MVVSAEGTASLEELLADLARPGPAGPVEVKQTHISAVFLAGDEVLKVKKPVDLGFVDYSTLERRRACCEAEVALNRRLAEGVYLGVVAIARDPADGRLRAGAPGRVVEWAVRMRRLPDERSLAGRLAAGTLDAALLDRVGRRLARFHREARRDEETRRFGGFDAVATACRENVTDTPGPELRPLLAALAGRLEEALAAARPLVEARAARGVPCDGHGDLRLDHVYELEGGELAVLDCVEFSARYRCGDPASDVAFLVMELRRARRDDLAAALVRGWVEASGDAEAERLIPLYVAYRAMVRAKVDALLATEEEVPAAARAAARERAARHLLLALSTLAPPSGRPALVAVIGLPGTGKSRLAAALPGFEWIRADVVRKRLLGLEPLARPGPAAYEAEHGARTYARCVALADEALLAGRRPLVDACFPSAARRAELVELGRRRGVPVVLLHLRAPAAVCRARVDARTGDPSDADAAVHDLQAARFEPVGAEVEGAALVEVDAAGPPEAVAAAALAALRAAGLAEAPPER